MKKGLRGGASAEVASLAWSPYPQPGDLPATSRVALCLPVVVHVLDLAFDIAVDALAVGAVG